MGHCLFSGLVYGRTSRIFLDFRFLLHASVPHRCPSELRAKIFHSHRFIDLRLRPFEGHRFRKAAGRRRVHLRIISRRSSLQYEYNEARRILPEDPLRYRALRKYANAKQSSISLRLNSMFFKRHSNNSQIPLWKDAASCKGPSEPFPKMQHAFLSCPNF